MRMVRFGVAGLRDPKDLEGSIAKVVEGGYAACEVQFVKEFTLKEPEAERLGTIAAAREPIRAFCQMRAMSNATGAISGRMYCGRLE